MLLCPTVTVLSAREASAAPAKASPGDTRRHHTAVKRATRAFIEPTLLTRPPDCQVLRAVSAPAAGPPQPGPDFRNGITRICSTRPTVRQRRGRRWRRATRRWGARARGDEGRGNSGVTIYLGVFGQRRTPAGCPAGVLVRGRCAPPLLQSWLSLQPRDPVHGGSTGRVGYPRCGGPQRDRLTSAERRGVRRGRVRAGTPGCRDRAGEQCGAAIHDDCERERIAS